jgi:hypothetical protein
MKTALIVASVCAVAATVGAQQPTTRPAAPPSSTISLSGCVQQADADGSIAGTPLGTSAPPEQAGAVANRNLPWEGYLLADAHPTTGDASAAPSQDATATGTAGAAGTSGAAGTTGAAAARMPVTYALDGDTTQLAGFKGQRVEVTGTIVEPAPSQAGASGSSSTFRTGVKGLKVTSIKSVAPKC